MNRKIFYLLTNNLYLMSPLVFKNHLKNIYLIHLGLKKLLKKKRLK